MHASSWLFQYRLVGSPRAMAARFWTARPRRSRDQLSTCGQAQL